MKIDRKRAQRAFEDYVKKYNTENDKVRLKIEHTYRVSELCEIIARSLGLPEKDVDVAWLIGLLHDVGRFEQLRNFGTFNDGESIDHAVYGAKILFDEGKIRDYVDAGWDACAAGDAVADEDAGADGNAGVEEDAVAYGNASVEEDAGAERDGLLHRCGAADKLIWTAVNYHNAYRIPKGLDARTEQFCHIIRDADKIDILKVNIEYPLEEIYNVTSEELRNGKITEAVMQAFEEEHAVLRSLKRTAVDNVVGHISLVYELVYPVSLQIVEEQGYLTRIMNFRTENAETEKQFVRIREKMNGYMKRRAGRAPEQYKK